MQEEWKAIPGWEDYYEVANTGKVRSKERVIRDKNFSKSGKPFIRERVFKSKELIGAKVSEDGHTSVGLYRNGRGSSQLIHRLVAQAFIPNHNNYPVVDHIDGNPKNNHVSNLRWADWIHNNRNTPYIRYLQSVINTHSICYKDQYEFESENFSS
jgi:hypothetical protein